jgi:hypothetical protein
MGNCIEGRNGAGSAPAQKRFFRFRFRYFEDAQGGHKAAVPLQKRFDDQSVVEQKIGAETFFPLPAAEGSFRKVQFLPLKGQFVKHSAVCGEAEGEALQFQGTGAVFRIEPGIIGGQKIRNLAE